MASSAPDPRKHKPLGSDPPVRQRAPSAIPPPISPAPSSTSSTTAPTASTSRGSGLPSKPPVANLAGAATYSDLFVINLTVTNKDGRSGETIISEVMAKVMSKFKVKIENFTDARNNQHTFYLQSKYKAELDKAKKSLTARLGSIVSSKSTTVPNASPKEQMPNQGSEQTGVRTGIPPDGSINKSSTSGTATPADKDNEEASAPINPVMPDNVSRVTQSIKDIPAHVLPFAVAHKADFDGLVMFSHSAIGCEITISGEYEAVISVVESVKATVEGYKKNLTSIKMSLPKRQHRLLQGAANEEIFAKSKCIVVAATLEDASDEIVIWGLGQDLPSGLGAVMEQANSRYTYEFPLPGPISFSRQILVYMTHIDYLTTLGKNYPDVNIYVPNLATIEEASILNIDIVGPKVDVDAVVRQISVFVTNLLGGIRQVKIDWLVHNAIIRRYTKKIEEFHNTHNVSVYFPPEDLKESFIMLVYDPLSPSASSVLAEKTKNLERVTVELLKMENQISDVKSKTIYVQKRWHKVLDVVISYSINGGENELSIKIGAEVGDVDTEDVVLIHGVSSDVDRVAKEIQKVVEDAKNNAIMNSYSTAIEVNHIRVHGNNHVLSTEDLTVLKLREELGVEVDVIPSDREKQGGKKEKAAHQNSKVIITGRKEHAEEAKRRIVAYVTRLANETQEILKIPPVYHPSLMGQGGKHIIHLEKQYGVRITFPHQSEDSHDSEQPESDEVLIKGDKEGVFGAKSKLLEAFESEKKVSTHIIHFTIPRRTIPLIVYLGSLSITEIEIVTGTRIDIHEPGPGDDPELTKVTVCGNLEAIADAQAAIEAIIAQADEEETAVVPVAQKYHSSIIGADGQGLKDLIAKCGGPTDLGLQARLIQFPQHGDSDMDKVQLCGEPQLVNKLKLELEEIIRALESHVVLAFEIPVVQRRALLNRDGQLLKELQTEFGVQIKFPDSESYYQIGEADNAADLKSVDPAHIIKVSGPRPACEGAIQALKSQVKSQVKSTIAEDVSTTIPIPLKYRNAILQQEDFLHNIHSYGVTIDTSAGPTVPSNPPLNDGRAPQSAESAVSEVFWDVIPNYQNAEEGSVELSLKAPNRASLDRAIMLMFDAIAHAKLMSHVGFLTLPDPSNFPHLFGTDDSYLAHLGKETGTNITFHKKSNAIVIIGAENDMMVAKDVILAIVARS